jgi:hypothetical protein
MHSMFGNGATMKEEDQKAFLDDFEKADVAKKLDMWYYALDQEALWEEVIAEMSNIATMEQLKTGKPIAQSEE